MISWLSQWEGVTVNDSWSQRTHTWGLLRDWCLKGTHRRTPTRSRDIFRSSQHLHGYCTDVRGCTDGNTHTRTHTDAEHRLHKGPKRGTTGLGRATWNVSIIYPRQRRSSAGYSSESSWNRPKTIEVWIYHLGCRWPPAARSLSPWKMHVCAA